MLEAVGWWGCLCPAISKEARVHEAALLKRLCNMAIHAFNIRIMVTADSSAALLLGHSDVNVLEVQKEKSIAGGLA